MRLGTVLFAFAFAFGCSFSGSPASSGDGDAPDGGDDPTSDGGDSDAQTVRCSFTKVDVCDDDVGPPLDLVADELIDTDNDPRCLFKGQADGSEVCVIYAASIEVGQPSTLRAVGTRPLALVASAEIVIDGSIDISSVRDGIQAAASNHSTCAVAADPESDRGGAAGAAGGSFATVGGDGGTGDTDNSLGGNGVADPGLAGPASVATVLRGGCPGDVGGDGGFDGGPGGAGGNSGGALYLASAVSITVAAQASLAANGAGGGGGREQAGGGGGGSGGHIALEAAAINNLGVVSVNGGGGGEGGVRFDGEEVIGNPGDDGLADSTKAAGGSSALMSAGFGGDGSASGSVGDVGMSSIVGAGGGGGAAGHIEVLGSLSGAGVFSGLLLLTED